MSQQCVNSVQTLDGISELHLVSLIHLTLSNHKEIRRTNWIHVIYVKEQGHMLDSRIPFNNFI